MPCPGWPMGAAGAPVQSWAGDRRSRAHSVVAENAGDAYIKLKLKDQLQSLTLLNEDPTLSKLKNVCVWA